jgi:hypothetical protein
MQTLPCGLIIPVLIRRNMKEVEAGGNDGGDIQEVQECRALDRRGARYS